jgi:hypothetical protein
MLTWQGLLLLLRWGSQELCLLVGKLSAAALQALGIPPCKTADTVGRLSLCCTIKRHAHTLV